MAAASDSAGGAADESLVKAEPASLGLLSSPQWEVGRDRRQHFVRDGAKAFVIEKVTLATPRETLNGIRMKLVGLYNLRGTIAR
jgi:hypothetical protein